MHVTDEAKVILEALKFLKPSREDIVSWADSKIDELDDPPHWLIEIFTSGSPRLADYIATLKANASEFRLTTNEKIIMCIDSYESGTMDLNEVLQGLGVVWHSTCVDENGVIPVSGEEQFDAGLGDVLSWLDQVAFQLSTDLQAAAHAAFANFRKTNSEVINPLPKLMGEDHCR